MPQSRKSQVSLVDTPYYHCISRCVRRAYLCGKDKVTGKCFEHRRQWVEDKLLFLSEVFSIDVCAYAVMSNHTHIVLHVDEPLAISWDIKDIITRWHKIFKGTLLTQDFLNNKSLSASELKSVEETAKIYRSRLMDISWFMRVLNERIARKANKEDECSGRFWEGRFKSQALLDEAALITCMAYVDLNPIRANIAKTPESSDYTSIKLRVQQALSQEPKKLMSFAGDSKINSDEELPCRVEDYLELVDLTGRCIQSGKRGFMSSKLPNILQRLSITGNNWLIMVNQFTKVFHGAVGSEQVLTEFTAHQHRQRRANICNSKKLFA